MFSRAFCYILIAHAHLTVFAIRLQQIPKNEDSAGLLHPNLTNAFIHGGLHSPSLEVWMSRNHHQGKELTQMVPQLSKFVPTTSDATSGKEFQMVKTRTYKNKKRMPVSTSFSWPRDLTTCKSTNWAVVTTIFNPTEAVKRMEATPGWCTVIVGDTKGPQKDEYLPHSPTVVHLSASDQTKIFQDLHLFKHLPWKSFGRKNLGYLFAMSQGAQTIFDFDDDNIPKNIVSPLVHSSGATQEVMEVTGELFANVYPLFTSDKSGQSLWPRGFPLSGIRAYDKPGAQVSIPNFARKSTALSSIGVEQTLADYNPDVDAIYRLTQKLPIKFDKQQPVVLEPGTFSPFNGQATFWHKPAFVGMLLPTSVNGRVADILRSYLAQPLLWKNGVKLAFTPPSVDVTDRNPHNLMGDFDAEWPLYHKVSKLVEFISDKSRKLSGRSLPEILFSLYVDMYEHEIVEETDVELARAWLEDLSGLGIISTHDLRSTASQASTEIFKN